MTMPWDGLAPDQRHAVWNSLSRAERAALLATSAKEISWTDGLPGEVRDHAGRIVLTEAIRQADRRHHDALAAVQDPRWTGRPSDGITLGGLERAAQHAAALHRLQEALDQPVGLAEGMASIPVRPMLLGIDPDRELIAFAIGDLDHASQIQVLVPGTGVGLEATGQWLQRTQDEIRLTQQANPARTLAAVTWMYGTPSLATMGFAAKARSAAPLLAEFVQGLRSRDPAADIDVVAHSYGCIVMTEAAARHGLYPAADRLFGLACPGTLVGRLQDLNVPAGRLYFTSAPNDLVRGTGYIRDIFDGNLVGFYRRVQTGEGPLWYGPNPADARFGAQVIRSEDRRPDSLNPWTIVEGSYTAHSQALDPNSEEAATRGVVHNAPLDPIPASFADESGAELPPLDLTANIGSGPAESSLPLGQAILLGAVMAVGEAMETVFENVSDAADSAMDRPLWEAVDPAPDLMMFEDTTARQFVGDGGQFGGGGASGFWEVDAVPAATDDQYPFERGTDEPFPVMPEGLAESVSFYEPYQPFGGDYGSSAGFALVTSQHIDLVPGTDPVHGDHPANDSSHVTGPNHVDAPMQDIDPAHTDHPVHDTGHITGPRPDTYSTHDTSHATSPTHNDHPTHPAGPTHIDQPIHDTGHATGPSQDDPPIPDTYDPPAPTYDPPAPTYEAN
ncbi:alpha/beta hydrolase [Dactylosporangium sp. NPDC049525]|uniref:alpha/beta hydrolase n=1 Tax=Dactylosporangium sp. NPDC049525 TaxID=3154730 RepID=UPI003423CFCE